MASATQPHNHKQARYEPFFLYLRLTPQESGHLSVKEAFTQSVLQTQREHHSFLIDLESYVQWQNMRKAVKAFDYHDQRAAIMLLCTPEAARQIERELNDVLAVRPAASVAFTPYNRRQLH